MIIPLLLKLKKENHKKIAKAQDLIIRELYNFFDRAVLHGGTAIWRCYDGNRFSEDIDVYLVKDAEKLNMFFLRLEQIGFKIIKKKITDNSLYSSLQLDNTIARFEVLFKKIKGSLKEYEAVESNFITVYTLLPEELIKEKVLTYLKRLKIRDLYDIFYLLRYVEDKNEIKSDLRRLIDNFKNPIDEKELKILIIEGLVPKAEEMFYYIKRYI